MFTTNIILIAEIAIDCIRIGMVEVDFYYIKAREGNNIHGVQICCGSGYWKGSILALGQSSGICR